MGCAHPSWETGLQVCGEALELATAGLVGSVVDVERAKRYHPFPLAV
jgi:hypothetical protein